MKYRFLSLALFSMAAFALPALAAPVLVEKHQIPVPKIDAAVLKSVSGVEQSYTYQDFDRNYFTKKGKNLPLSAKLLREMDCQDTTFRLWSAGLDTPTLSRRIGFLVTQTSPGVTIAEAKKGGKSKWKVLSGYSASMFCGSGNSALFITTGSAHHGGTVATYDTFSDDSIWTHPKYPNLPNASGYGVSIVDGVRQMPGYLSRYYGETKPYGDSRVLVLDGPSEGLHTLPWYRDLNSLVLKTGESYYVSFYRLSDGYGVIETYYPPSDCTVNPCSYPPAVVTYYRIHDGESTYSVVPSLPLPTSANSATVSVYRTGMNIYSASGYPIDLTFHDLPKSVLDNYNLRQLNYGSVAWENAKQYVVRYFVASSAKNVQYWQAVIQK